MSEQKQKIGSITWRDLTVPNAEEVRDFYKGVIGWTSEGVEMDGYSDFNMMEPGSGDTVAGICHARGNNADLPAQWLMYITVENVDRSAARCAELGGKVIAGPRPVGGGRFCVVQDPAGAVCALWSPPA